MNNEQIMEQLKKVGGLQEVYHKTSFWGYRRNAKGEDQKVSVDILDMGQGSGNRRYHCVVKQDDLKTAPGNEAESIEEAIAIFHWQNLD